MAIAIEDITVGMPVTVSIGSDCNPYEVVGIKGKTVIIRECTPVNMSDWTSGCDTTEYKSCPEGAIKEVTNRGSHGWHVKGDYRSPSYGWCYHIHFGVARHYRDPSF